MAVSFGVVLLLGQAGACSATVARREARTMGGGRRTRGSEVRPSREGDVRLGGRSRMIQRGEKMLKEVTGHLR